MSTEVLANNRVTTLSDGTEYFFTLARWHNALLRFTKVVGGQKVETEEWRKHISHGGKQWFSNARYGAIYPNPGYFVGKCGNALLETHDDHGPQRDGHQVAVVCAPGTRLIAVDVDNPERYALSNTAELVTVDDAVCRRGNGWHAYVYVPEHLTHRWPKQGPCGGWDVKSMGFVPLPGSIHHSGETYQPADGEILIATEELMDALNEDRAGHIVQLAKGGASGEVGDGNEPWLFSYAGSLVRAGYGREEAWQLWLAEAQKLPLSIPDWGWSEDDRDVFERQWAYCEQMNEVNHGFEVTLPMANAVNGVETAPSLVNGFATLTLTAPAPELTAEVETPPTVEADASPTASEEDAWAAVDEVDFPGPDDPLGVARRLARRWRRDEGEREVTTAHWHETWWRWVGTHWQETSDRTIRNETYRWLEDKEWPRPTQRRVDGAVVTVNVPTPWRPDQRSVGNVLDAAKAVVEIRDEVDAGTWLGDQAGSRPSWLIACRNGLLDPVTGTLWEHSPAYLNTHSLPFEHDPAAGCDRWLGFVDQVFKGDAESRDLLQEWFGYVLSGATSAQKMMFMFGPTRSGKGTTARVLNQLLGVENVAAPTLGSFASQFGRATMIGKPLAVIADARSSGKIDKQAVIEQLLAITGEDRVEVDRKNRAQWVGTLPTRVQMMSNELPWFRDSSAAIAKRLLVLWYRRSFLGKEDTSLEDALRGELPGILNWALVGLARWRAAGRFTVPAVSRDLHEEIDQQASPISEFVAERCRLGEGLSVLAADLFKAWVGWQGDILPTRSEQVKFGNALRAALPGVTRVRQSVNGNREYMYHGIELTHSVAAWVAARPS